MHEENFLSSWLREDGEDKRERHMEVDRVTEEEMGKKKRIREEEKEENETVIVKRRCVNLVSWVIRGAVVILGVICGMFLVACLTVIL